ncbi:hypothetical protein RND81_06G012400 [Saponaria officinalis]|uniref:L-ascorbate peroxidase n=1 Tax=Saponaria officinalis TaxID=3572 RepID=A0AAW1K5Y0_SAPOF
MAQMVRNDEEYERQIESAYRDLLNLLSQNKQFAPTLLRLAFHDAGTYDAQTNTGGVNGSVRFELNNPPNVKMDIAVNFCEPVKQRQPKISYADLYQLAGVVAVEVTGGPKIRFVSGRKDAPQQQDQGALPNPNGGSQHLRDIFHRMGLSDKDIVVLSGAHTLGRAHQDRSGFDGPLTRDPLQFDNSYYVELMKGDTPGIVKFPTDKALMQDPIFRRHVEVYARDEKKFFKHYAKSHKKMSELGFNPNQHDSHQHHPQPMPRPHPNQHHHSPPHQQRSHCPSQCRPRPPCGFA